MQPYVLTLSGILNFFTCSISFWMEICFKNFKSSCSSLLSKPRARAKWKAVVLFSGSPATTVLNRYDPVITALWNSSVEIDSYKKKSMKFVVRYLPSRFLFCSWISTLFCILHRIWLPTSIFQPRR